MCIFTYNSTAKLHALVSNRVSKLFLIGQFQTSSVFIIIAQQVLIPSRRPLETDQSGIAWKLFCLKARAVWPWNNTARNKLHEGNYFEKAYFFFFAKALTCYASMCNFTTVWSHDLTGRNSKWLGLPLWTYFDFVVRDAWNWPISNRVLLEARAVWARPY